MQKIFSKGVTIIADTLEEKIIDELKKIKGCNVIEKRLKVADFILSESVGIERKKAGDFVRSIMDGRLFRQVEELKKNFEKPVLIIEGNNFKRIHPNALRGTLATLAVDFHVPIIWTRNSEDTALTIYFLAKREQEEKKKSIGFKGKKKANTLEDYALNVLCSFPGIGMEKAKTILNHTGNLRSFFMMDKVSLKNIPGIGEKLATQISEILNYRKR